MMVAEFMNYYHYKLDDVLNMYALAFFALLASMYRLNGVKAQEVAYTMAVAQSGGKVYKEFIEAMEKQAKGARGILDEIRVIRNTRKKK